MSGSPDYVVLCVLAHLAEMSRQQVSAASTYIMWMPSLQHPRGWLDMQHLVGITMDLVLDLMSFWEVISIKTLQCLSFKPISTIMITKWMTELYVTLHSHKLELMWHFGLVIFCCLIHRNRTLYPLAVKLKTKSFALHLTLRRWLLVWMIIVTLLCRS